MVFEYEINLFSENQSRLKDKKQTQPEKFNKYIYNVYLYCKFNLRNFILIIVSETPAFRFLGSSSR